MFQEVVWGASFEDFWVQNCVSKSHPVHRMPPIQPDEAPQALAALAEQGELNLEDLSEEEVGWLPRCIFVWVCFLVHCVFFWESEERIEILFVCVKILGIFEIVGFVAGLEGIPFNQKMSECRFFTKNNWKNEKKKNMGESFTVTSPPRIHPKESSWVILVPLEGGGFTLETRKLQVRFLIRKQPEIAAQLQTNCIPGTGGTKLWTFLGKCFSWSRCRWQQSSGPAWCRMFPCLLLRKSPLDWCEVCVTCRDWART